MKYSGLNICDTANGPGIRVSLFVSGCTNRCKGCFSSQTWDFDFGEEFTESVLSNILNACEPSYVRGLSILGGEPMHPRNSTVVLHIVEEFRKKFRDTKDIWVWTGYEIDHLVKSPDDEILAEFKKSGYSDYPCSEESRKLVKLCDVFVTGRFVEEKKDLTLAYCGSSNQRIVDCSKINILE